VSFHRGCEIPDDLFYDVDHDVWVRFEDGGDVTLGMTDPAQSRCGKLVNIRFKRVGRSIRRGQSLATIESAKWVGPFPAVLSGEIVANNASRFEQDILAANKDPYGRGWLARLRPIDIEAERGTLQPGSVAIDRYRERIDEMDLQCFRCAEADDAQD